MTIANWPKETDANRKSYEAWLKTMNEKYPYVTVKTDEWAYDTNSFLPKAASGQLANLYTTWYTEVNKIIDAGYAGDITDAVKKYGYDKNINPDVLSILSKDGKYYALPGDNFTGAYLMGMFYNVNLFKKAGLVDEKGVPKFPQTYDELAQTAKIIKDKTGKAGFFFPTKNNQGGWQFMNIAWSYGAEFEKKVDGKWKAVYNSPEAVSALQYVKDLKWKYNVLTDNVLVDVNEMFKLFGTDQLGMSYGIIAWGNNIVNDYKMSKDNLAMSTVPAGPKSRTAVLGGGVSMFSPNSTPEQIDAGIKWLEVMGISPNPSKSSLDGLETQMKNDQSLGRIVGPHGIRIWTSPERVKAEDDLLNKYCDINLDMWSNYAASKDVTLKAEEPVNCQELYKALDGVVQAVLTDKNADPKQLLDKSVANFQKDYLDKAQ